MDELVFKDDCFPTLAHTALALHSRQVQSSQVVAAVLL